MSTIVLFHHALGVTTGLERIAEKLREDGHRVVVPDLFDGRSFTAIEDGVEYAETIGFDGMTDRGVMAVDGVDDRFVALGVSLGVLPAQKLAQTDDRVLAAVLVDAALPVEAFGGSWPALVPLRLHLGSSDPFVQEDLVAARELVAAAADGVLRLHETAHHLTIDPSSPFFDAEISHRILTDVRHVAGQVGETDG